MSEGETFDEPIFKSSGLRAIKRNALTRVGALVGVVGVLKNKHIGEAYLNFHYFEARITRFGVTLVLFSAALELLLPLLLLVDFAPVGACSSVKELKSCLKMGCQCERHFSKE